MEQTAPSHHVLVLPFPAEGHIKPLLNLSKLLCRIGGLRITFVNTHHNHARLHDFTDLQAFHAQFPEFHFASITDGLPPNHPRSGPTGFAQQLSPTCRSMAALEFRELIKTAQWGPPSCIIADGMMSTIAMDVARGFHVPVIAFRTYSATCTWVTLHITEAIQEGVFQVQDQGDMDKLVTGIPGLENLLRDRDLPSVFRLKPGSLGLDFYMKETTTMAQASALILNTFDQLESPVISNLATIFPKVHTIGPLHTFVNTRFTNNNKDGALRKEDRSCIAWLDHQNPKSVLYVSFGTVVVLSRDQLLEFWYGLVNSLMPFLWVIRQDLTIGEGGLGDRNAPEELELGNKEGGHVVDWAPQEEVLAHPAVGGFLTHSGWNSTLESISEGVPMLCWPLIADQTVNSRCVSELWRIGLDMNGTCDRVVVENMVKDLMENKNEELTKSAGELAKKAKESVKENGSSHHNLENLIEDIRAMKVIH